MGLIQVLYISKWYGGLGAKMMVITHAKRLCNSLREYKPFWGYDQMGSHRFVGHCHNFNMKIDD